MSKKVINSVVKESGKKITDLANEVIYTPTTRQRQIKAQFWSRFQPGPFSDPNNLSMADIQAVTKASGLKEWWPKPGFQSWFMNQEEAREKLEYLFMKALDTAEDILDDPNSNGNAKVQMIKVIGELANKFPSKWEQKYADDDINKMSEKQLVNYLEKKGVHINEEKVIDVSKETTDED